MSTGEGIIWATIILLISTGFFFVTKKKKWRIVGKILGILILLVVLINVGIFAYYRYQESPRPQNSIYEIELGMLPVEVKLILGEPAYEGNRDNSETKQEDLYFLYKAYSWSDSNDIGKYIRFTKQDGEYRAYLICDDRANEQLFGFDSYTTEDEVIKKLGTPTNESIRADGLSKILTFGDLNVSFTFEKNKVTSFCVTDDNEVTFVEEYES